MQSKTLSLLFYFQTHDLFPDEPKKNFVHSIEGFKKQIQLHREIVVTLGLFLSDQFPSHFSKIDKSLLKEFLGLHDDSKLSPKIAEALFSFYGQHLSLMSESQKLKFLVLRKNLNQIDQENAELFFKRTLIYPEVAKQYLRIEKIADLVDREHNPGSREEFNRPMISAYDFLKQTSIEDANLAEYLSKNYSRLVRHLFYRIKEKTRVSNQKFRSHRLFDRSCLKFFVNFGS